MLLRIINIPKSLFFLYLAETAPSGFPTIPRPRTARCGAIPRACAASPEKRGDSRGGTILAKLGNPTRWHRYPTGVPTRTYIFAFDRLPPPRTPSILGARPAHYGTNPNVRGESLGSTGLTRGGFRPKPKKTPLFLFRALRNTQQSTLTQHTHKQCTAGKSTARKRGHTAHHRALNQGQTVVGI